MNVIMSNVAVLIVAMSNFAVLNVAMSMPLFQLSLSQMSKVAMSNVTESNVMSNAVMLSVISNVIVSNVVAPNCHNPIFLVFAVSEMSMDRVPSNFALSSATFPQRIDVSRGSIVTVVIDENVARMTSSSMSNENGVRVTPSSMSTENNAAQLSPFEMATSFSAADDQSVIDDGAQVGPLPLNFLRP
jgi:hypothetical protein